MIVYISLPTYVDIPRTYLIRVLLSVQTDYVSRYGLLLDSAVSYTLSGFKGRPELYV